jgi:hypothetical protein
MLITCLAISISEDDVGTGFAGGAFGVGGMTLNKGGFDIDDDGRGGAGGRREAKSWKSPSFKNSS